MLPSNTVEEMEANVESVVEWAAAFEKQAKKKERAAAAGVGEGNGRGSEEEERREGSE